MIASIGGGSGFGGAAGYCLGGGGGEEKEEEHLPGLSGAKKEERERDETERLSARERQQAQESHPPGRSASGQGDDEERERRRAETEKKAETEARRARRVEWAETRNLATHDVMRGARLMEATARDAPVLKRRSGVKATGRKLKKPMVHYSLNWAKDERPDRQEMSRAVDGSLKTLGLENHQALVVAHGDRAHPHVHVIVNRVHPETGKAANMGRDRIKLSKWAERYEREQGQIRCPQRQANNYRRARGEWVRHRQPSQARQRRERMSSDQAERVTKENGRTRIEIDHVACWRAEEHIHWKRHQQERGKALDRLDRRNRQEWSALYERHKQERTQQTEACRSVWGRLRQWGAQGGRLRDVAGAGRGRADVLERWERALEQRQKQERVSLGKVHAGAVRDLDHQVGERYWAALEGSERRARRNVWSYGKPIQRAGRSVPRSWVREQRAAQWNELRSQGRAAVVAAGGTWTSSAGDRHVYEGGQGRRTAVVEPVIRQGQEAYRVQLGGSDGPLQEVRRGVEWREADRIASQYVTHGDWPRAAGAECERQPERGQDRDYEPDR